MNAIVPKETIVEICAHRDRAIALYTQVSELMGEAYDAHRSATQIGGNRTFPHIASDSNDRGWHREELLARITQNVDRDMWRGIIIGTKIGSLMDREELERFKADLEKNPPPATADNVYATLERLMGEADTIFRRGLVNAFKTLDREYASNDGFKIGERIVLTWGCTWDKNMGYFTLSQRREQEFQDIDRVMHVLDGKPAPDHQQGLCAALREHTYSRGRDKDTKGESEYFRYRLFKNGNIHLWPKRQDLLDKCNRIIAEHFGLVLAADRDVRDARPDYRPRPGEVLKRDFFPTPEPVVLKILENLWHEPGMRVLEPSAGTGAIAGALRHVGLEVDCIEIDAGRAERLRADGFPVRVADFLEVEPDPVYDLIAMNPPFSRHQDVRHVLHALQFLRPGGRLVAVLGAGAEHGNDRLSESLLREVSRMGGHFEALPEGSFKESGTGVRTVLLVLDKPAGAGTVTAERMAA